MIDIGVSNNPLIFQKYLARFGGRGTGSPRGPKKPDKDPDMKFFILVTLLLSIIVLIIVFEK